MKARPTTLMWLFPMALAMLSMMLPAAAGEDLNVVLITVDTLRADRLGCYGYKQVKTPNCDALAAKGFKFSSAYSQVPFTLPSHASLFTGTYPMWNGVRDTTGPPLGKDVMTLAGVLRQSGYATAGFPAAFVLDEFFGLKSGFDYYYGHFAHRDPVEGREDAGLHRSADEQLKILFDWINSNSRKKFFAWLHLYDTHHPYDPPEPYRTLYRNRPYDGEVAYVDSAIGKLLDYLAAGKLAENTMVVLTSDHGEGLGAHGELYHGYFVYDSTLRVPLLIFNPRLKTPPREIQTSVRLLDVAPTVLDAVGVPPPAQMQGHSLVPLLTGKEEIDVPVYGEGLFANRHFGWAPLYSLRIGRYKLIQAPKPELYDVESDPEEKVNLYSEKRDVAVSLKRRMERVMTRYSRTLPPPASSKLSAEAIANLRSLGYLGGPAEVSKQLSTHLPDPKDKLNLYNLYLRGLFEQGEGRLAEAVTTYQRILTSDSTPSIVYHELGNVYFRLRNYDKAIEQFNAAIERNPLSEPYLLDLARTYGEMGRFHEAAVGYKRALTLSPDDFAALNNLGVMFMKMDSWNEATQTLEDGERRGSPLKETYYHLGVCYQRSKRLDEAAVRFRKAVQIDVGFAAPYYNLGTIEALAGKDEAAAKEFRKALDAEHDFPEARFNLGVIHARRGDLDAAIQELREAIRLRPKFAEAHFNLGTVYAKLGRVEDAIIEFKKATSIQPDFAEAHRGLALMYQRGGMIEEASSEKNILTKLDKGQGSGSKSGRPVPESSDKLNRPDK